MEKLMNEYLDYLKLIGKNKDICKTVKYRLNKFRRYLNDSGLSIMDAGVREVRDFKGILLESGLCHDHINSILSEVRVFYRHLKTRGAVSINPFCSVRYLRFPVKLPVMPLNENEMNILLKYICDFDNPDKGLLYCMKHYVVHVVSELLYSTGMRIGEAASINITDLDLKKGEVKVKGKGGKERICFLNTHVKRVLNIYIKKLRPWTYSRLPEKKCNKLFPLGKDQLEAKTNEVLKDICIKTGLRVQSSHGFRHAFGSHMLRAGCDIRIIQDFLGHKSLHTTQIYTKMDKKDLKKALDQYHPRKWRSNEKL